METSMAKVNKKKQEADVVRNDSDVFVGIDNGLTGALVVVDKVGKVLAKTLMFVRNKKTGREVNPTAVAEWIEQQCSSYNKVAVVLEVPGKFGQCLALASMHDSYGCLRTMLEVLGYHWIPVNPQKWQKVMIPKCEKGETKPRALAKAKELWPSETWFPTVRCSKPNPDMVDAALMAEYGRLEKL